MEGVCNYSVMDDMRALEEYITIDKFKYDDLKKKSKALEIIKDKPYEVDWIVHLLGENTSYQMYVDLVTESKNKLLERYKLTQDEYNLLKEVLYE